MYILTKKIINLLSIIPFLNGLLRLFYHFALKQIPKVINEFTQIQDALLLSDFSKDKFIAGCTDLRILFILEDNTQIYQSIKLIEKRLLTIWPINILLSFDNIEYMKSSEFQTPLIRSYLNKKHSFSEAKWLSLKSKKLSTFPLKEQDHISIQNQLVSDLEQSLLHFSQTLLTRNKVKSFAQKVYTAINGLISYKFLSGELTQAYKSDYQKLIGYHFISAAKLSNFKKSSLELIDHKDFEFSSSPSTVQLKLPQKLQDLLMEIMKYDFINDILVTPALIQFKQDSIDGRVYIDLVLKSKNLHKSLQEVKQILYSKRKIISKEELKLIFNFTTYELLHLKNSYHLSRFPLRSHLRAQSSLSLSNHRYVYSKDLRRLKKACLHFFVHEYFKFRKKAYDDELQSSKFIKSLNLIYQYRLILEFLEGKEFAISHHISSITENLGVQLKNIAPNDKMNYSQWRQVRSQLLLSLKQIRNELAKQYPSIRNLHF